MKAFILAAGLGTRLSPLTDNKPKALVEIGGVPMLEIVIKRLISQGFDDLIINVHYFSDQIIRWLEDQQYFGVHITISDESDLLLDTGGAILKAGPYFDKDESLLIHNTDVLTDIDLRKFAESHNNSKALVSLAVQKRESSNYLMFDEDDLLCGWRSVKTGNERMMRKGSGVLHPMGFSGVHIIGPGFLETALKNECILPGKTVFSIISVYLCLAEKYKLMAFDHTSSFWMDIGRHDKLALANRLISKGKFKF